MLFKYLFILYVYMYVYIFNLYIISIYFNCVLRFIIYFKQIVSNHFIFFYCFKTVIITTLDYITTIFLIIYNILLRNNPLIHNLYRLNFIFHPNTRYNWKGSDVLV